MSEQVNPISINGDPDQIGNLYDKMTKIMAQLEPVKALGKNEHFRYKYIRLQEVLGPVKQALSDHGVAFFVSMGRPEVITWESTKKADKPNEPDTTQIKVKTQALFFFTFADKDSGASITLPYYAHSIDENQGDLSKAATQAQKNFFLKTFLIDSEDDQPQGQGQQRQRSPQRQPQAQSQGQGPKGPAATQASKAQAATQAGPANGKAQAAATQTQAKTQEQPQGDQSKAASKLQQPNFDIDEVVPEKENDYATYYNKSIVFFRVGRDEAMQVLRDHNNNAIAAFEALKVSWIERQQVT